jgi:hypothetical protein
MQLGIRIFRAGQIFAQMPHEEHFSSAKKALSIEATWGRDFL